MVMVRMSLGSVAMVRMSLGSGYGQGTPGVGLLDADIGVRGVGGGELVCLRLALITHRPTNMDTSHLSLGLGTTLCS